MHKRSISPVISTLILVIIVVSACMLYYSRISEMFSRSRGSVEIRIEEVKLYKFEDKVLLIVSIENSGGKPVAAIIITGRDDNGKWFALPVMPSFTSQLQGGLFTICREWGVASYSETGPYAENLSEFRYGLLQEKTMGVKVLANVDTVGNPIAQNVNDKYSLQYVGYIYIPDDGTYQFAVDGSDAVAILIDDNEVASWYGQHEFSGDWSHTGSITLSRGYHKFEVLMQEWDGSDGVKAAWKKPGDMDFSIIPQDHFYYVELQPSGIANCTRIFLPEHAFSFTNGKAYMMNIMAYSPDGDVYVRTISVLCS